VTTFDVERARRETPGCHKVVHLNNAGASLPPEPVVDAVVDYLRSEALTGGYELEARESERAQRYRFALAALMGAHSHEIAWAVSDTAAFTTALGSLLSSGSVPPGSTVVVDRATYVSHYLGLLQAVRTHDLRIEVAESTPSGELDVTALSALLDERVSLACLTHVGTHRGSVNPVAEAGAAIRAAGEAIYLLDVCQSLGQLPIDVHDIGCDIATGTGRKFLRAPRGTGVLYVAESLVEQLDPPGVDSDSATWIDADNYLLPPDARRFEPFECSVALRVGLGVAADYAMQWGIEAIAHRITGLAEHLRDRLTGHGAIVYDGGQQRCGIVTFTVPGEQAERTQERLGAAGINTSVVSPDTARLDATSRAAAMAVRASVHYYNTSAEIDQLLEVLAIRS